MEKEIKEHDSASCSICQKMGNYAQCHSEPFGDKVWWDAHRKARINIDIREGFEDNPDSGFELGFYTYIAEKRK